LTIIGDSTNFTNASVTSELRRLIKVTGDRVNIHNLKMEEGIYGIEFTAVTGGSVKDCDFINTTISHDTISTYPNQNNCQAIYITGDSRDVEVSGNRISGWGEFVFSGQRCRGLRFVGNTCELQGDNSLYLSGFQLNIVGNVFRNIRQAGIKTIASNTSIVSNQIYTTGSYEGYAGIYIQALNNYTGQVPDANGNNSYNISIIGNDIDGDFSSAGIVAVENPVDASGWESILIDSNVLRGRETTATATSGPVGIQLQLTAANLKTYASAVTNNRIAHFYRGITFVAPSTGYNTMGRIAGNQIWKCVENGMTITYSNRLEVTNNTIYDSIGTMISPAAFRLIDVTYSSFRGNHVGNSSAAGKLYHLFYEISGCSNNFYTDNIIEQSTVDYTLHYSLNDSSGEIMGPSSRVRNMPGNLAICPGELHCVTLKITSGLNHTYTPIGQFTSGYPLRIINGSATANTITFDPAGVNVLIVQGEANDFVYNGTAWVDVTSVIFYKKGTTAAIATGTAITHSLGATPSQVLVTATGTGLSDIYVSAIGATTFTINFAGAGSHILHWMAIK
jgi:hypothetical protein